MMDGAAGISKARACIECKKHKVKCEKRPGESACTRCRRHNYKCASNNQLQTFIEEDSSWKRAATAKTAQLQAAIVDLLRHKNCQHLSNPSSIAQISPFDPEFSLCPRAETATMSMTPENSLDPEAELEPELISSPMYSLFEVTKLRDLRSSPPTQPPVVNGAEDDLISRGLISLKEAEYLFAFFSRKMNHFLCGGIALAHSDLESVRESSSLLLTSILAIAALHMPGRSDTFDICYSAFITVLSNSLFNRYHTLDEIRGLAIGAFWLSDLSWMLSGHAVRIATEMGLHQSLQKLFRGKHDQFQRAQLWYLLYVCDHHFSIAYSRPPVTHESEGIINYEGFLQHPSAGPGDVMLIAQVALSLSLSNAYHRFGSDSEEALKESDFRLLRGFDVEIETWRMKWESESEDNAYIGSYPSKAIVLHYYFAKFQLNSLSLRAVACDTNLSTDRREAANIAISSAIATLNMVLYEPDIRAALVGVPLFTHTMVAFSAVFLLKVAGKWSSASLNIDRRQVVGLVQNIVDVMSGVKASDKHLTHHITNGLKKVLAKFKSTEMGGQPQAIPIMNGIPTAENEGLPQVPGEITGHIQRDHLEIDVIMTGKSVLQRKGNGPRRIVGVSLKMYFSIEETIAYVEQLQQLGPLATACNVELFVIPDLLSLPMVSNVLKDVPSVIFGAQDCFWEDRGAYTGEVSPRTLKSLGCSLVELGHAERRRLFGETDADVQRKAGAVERNGMVPLICIGEKTHQSTTQAVEECRVQIEAALKATEKEVIFAYEPVWAIGQAEAASAEYVVEVTKGLRKLCQGRDVTIIYGGSAGPGTFQPMSQGVDGLFLGRFAHDIKNVHNIIKEIASANEVQG
ncbi:hypothetical protein B7463_g6209, partial [Scytalidium lignicola]